MNLTFCSGQNLTGWLQTRTAFLFVLVAFLIFLPEMGLNLGKIAAESMHRSNSSLQGLALAEGDKILRRIAETKTVCSALRAQQLHFGGSEISNQTRNQGLSFDTIGDHLLLLVRICRPSREPLFMGRTA